MLVDALLEANRTAPKTLAVEDSTRSFTYSQLAQLASVFRDIVTEQTQRERVGLLLPASAILSPVLFGTLWAKRIAVPLNFLLAPEELLKVVKDSDIDVIFTVTHFRELVSKLPARAVFLEELPLKRKMVFAFIRSLPQAPTVQPNDTAVMLYTSGTTADPKGVELSYQNFRSNIEDAAYSLELKRNQVFLNILPPFHVFGLTANVFAPVFLNSTSQSIPRFSPMAVVKACSEKKVTLMLAIPSMYAAILKTKSADREDFKTVQLAISGGEPLPDRIRDAFRERFGVLLREGYGLTETSPILAACSLVNYKPGTVGKPLRSVQIRILTAEGKDAGINEDGEILVRGPNVMKGYYKKPEETRKVFTDDGWFKTGDIGQLDADGFLKITGRAKDMLIIGGENVFPREIEAILEEFEGVLQAAVIGIPDDLRGEAPVAFIIPKEGATLDEQALRAHAKQSLAGYKVPKRVIISEDLPKGPTGKILKRKLKDLL